MNNILKGRGKRDTDRMKGEGKKNARLSWRDGVGRKGGINED